MALTDTVLTETIIDISDQHTVPTLTSTLALPLASDQDYCALHQRIAGSARQCASYSEVRGVEGKVLDQLCLGYVDEKFWHYILNDDIRRFPIHAWRSILPLVGSLKPRIEFLKGHWTFDIKPLTRVTIYPFGWSTRISLRIVGRHTISDLADVVDYIFNGQCIKPDGAPKALRLDQYFYDVAEGVREDAFAGSLTNDVPGAEPLMVITVLAKQGPSPSV